MDNVRIGFIRGVVCVLVLFFTTGVMAQSLRKRKVHGTYTYYAPMNVTPEQAQKTALERAKCKAMADEFGTIVAQTNLTNVSNTNGESDVRFQSYGMSELKGEWIETIGKPKYEPIKYEDNLQIVTVTVNGWAREIPYNRIDLDVHLLKNGKTMRFEDDRFKNGDKIYLLFKSPEDGFLAVYLVDDTGKAFCLLPYPEQNGRAYDIVHGKEYLLFDRNDDTIKEESYIDGYYLTTNKDMEYNQIYVIFSPNKFSKAVDSRNDYGLPPTLDEGDFQKWLVKCRRHDPDMQLIPITITIKQ